MQQATIGGGDAASGPAGSMGTQQVEVRDQLMYAALNLPEPIFSTRSLVATPARLGKFAIIPRG